MYSVTNRPVISAEELTELLSSRDDVRLLDVRTPGEYESAHIPGAYNVPLDYRDQYYDTDDSLYRYADGNIYQVDAKTQIIQAIVDSSKAQGRPSTRTTVHRCPRMMAMLPMRSLRTDRPPATGRGGPARRRTSCRRGDRSRQAADHHLRKHRLSRSHGGGVRTADRGGVGASARPRLGRGGGGAPGCGREGQGGDDVTHQDLASRGWTCTGLRFMRFTTWPASWPQAASMSSPRVLRVVTVMPARCRISAKRRMRSGLERR